MNVNKMDVNKAQTSALPVNSRPMGIKKPWQKHLLIASTIFSVSTAYGKAIAGTEQASPPAVLSMLSAIYPLDDSTTAPSVGIRTSQSNPHFLIKPVSANTQLLSWWFPAKQPKPRCKPGPWWKPYLFRTCPS